MLLIKSLYGIRQAPKLWYQFFAQAVKGIGLRRAQSRNCLFISSGPNPVYVIVYVDDLLTLGPKEAVHEIKGKLSQFFTVVDLGPCFFFLGINIIRDTNAIYCRRLRMSRRLLPPVAWPIVNLHRRRSLWGIHST